MAAKKVAQASPRVIAARINGRKGGLATALKHGADFCQARSEKAGNASKLLFGSDYYKYIASLRKNPKGWPKNKLRKARLPEPVLQQLMEKVSAIRAT